METTGRTRPPRRGDGDPRRFAAAWAKERGLVAEPPAPKKTRKTVLDLGRARAVLGVLLLGVLLGIGAVALFATTHVSTSGPRRAQVSGIPALPSVRVPNFVGSKACEAERIARNAGLDVRGVPNSWCDAHVVGQTPAAGPVVRRQSQHGVVTLRLRRR